MRRTSAIGTLMGASLLIVLLLPLVALALSSSVEDLRAGFTDPLFGPALSLSIRTTLISLVITLGLGTPLAWWLSRSPSKLRKVVAVLVDLPIVIPPAVVGVALLQTFGRQGLVGPLLTAWSIQVPFTESAVVLAQVVVSSPFFVQAAANAFRKVDDDVLIVAQTLGATRRGAFFRIALPMALPGLVVGASLAWARAIGEFGATLLFAGNMTGTTQTMPLAIFTALESDVDLAVAFSLALVAASVVLLAGIRLGTIMSDRVSK